jgi:hypothetical protein
MPLRSSLRKFLPVGIRSSIRRVIRPQATDQERAQNYATTSKRVDICAAQIAHELHCADIPSIQDKVCLEIGSGWLLSHALVLHLLGARKVFATDIARHARPKYLRASLHSSVISVIRDVLSPFESHSAIRARLDQLLSVDTFTFEKLQEAGIEYIAPIDLVKHSLDRSVDFVYSTSVLEHVPCDDILPLLMNLTKDLSGGGQMIHCIHLEDHRDITGRPWDFLSETADVYTRAMQSAIGNRIRASQWKALGSRVPSVTVTAIYEWQRPDRPLPAVVDPSI